MPPSCVPADTRLLSPQHTAAQNEQLQQALDRLQQEHAELQQRASALQEDNQLQAEHISTIEGTAQGDRAAPPSGGQI